MRKRARVRVCRGARKRAQTLNKPPQLGRLQVLGQLTNGQRFKTYLSTSVNELRNLVFAIAILYTSVLVAALHTYVVRLCY